MPEHGPPLNPLLQEIIETSYGALDDFKKEAPSLPEDLVDLGVGDPLAPYPAFVRRALADGLPEVSSYPRAIGLPVLREAIAGWCRRRFGVQVDASAEVVPTHGSKEAIATFGLIASGRHQGEARKERTITVVTDPAYVTPERGAQFAGSEVMRLPLLPENGFLPDIGSVPAVVWNQVSTLWVNYPNNPTGATAPLEFFDELASLAAKYGFWLASDEAYTDVYFGDPPPSALQVADRSRVVVFASLSKRSGLTGMRSAGIVAPAELIGAARTFRAMFGLTSPEFIQRAAAAAWADDDHARRLRDDYRRKHQLFIDLFDRKGWPVHGRDATPYLWIPVSADWTSESFALSWLDAGVAVTPGSYFGHSGEGYVRIAALGPDAACGRACEILDRLL